MIEQSESGLTTGEYSELETLRTSQAYSLTLRRLSFSWTTVAGSETDAEFDADTTTDRVLRALAGSSITVEGRASDALSWTDLSAGITGADSGIIPSIYAGGTDTVRVFYYDGSAIKYKESTDGGDTWGSATSVGTVANVVWLAAVSSTKVHYATYDSYNTRLHYAEYSGSWSSTDSTFYWPGEFYSFDAETIGSYDVIVFDAWGQERYTTVRQGIWACRQRGSQWGTVYEVDVVDEYTADDNERELCLLSKIDGRLFCTYVAQDASFKAACYGQSADGRFWQHRQPLGDISVKGKMVTLGDYTFFVNGELFYRSASTPIVGNSTVEYSVTSRATSLTFSREKVQGMKVVLDNDDDGLIDLTGFERWELLANLGYYGQAGSALVVQVALCEVDSIETATGLPLSEVQLTARDRMAWLTDRTESDHYKEISSQLRHWDDFVNVYDETTDKDILHSGMGSTATMEGYWGTEEGADEGIYELRLKSHNTEGLALCTVSKFIGHTIVQEAFQVPTSGNSEWAGIVFRALDEDNYWCAYYDQATDTVKLRQKKSDTWQTPVSTTGALSWSVATWYWLRVEAKLSRYVVYYSTDGLTWTQAFAYVDQTYVAEVLDFFKEGYVGHAGYGYSDEDTEPYEPPDYNPPDPYVPPVESYTLYDQFIVGTDNGAAYADTETVITGGTPTWTACGLSGKNVSEIMLRQENSEAWALTTVGLYSTSLPFSGSSSWSARVTTASIYATLGWGSNISYAGLQASWLDTEKMWFMAHVYTGTVWIPYCIITTNSFTTYTMYRIGTGQSSFLYGQDLKVVNDGTENVLYASGSYYTWGGQLFKSTNGGTSWTPVQNLGSFGHFRHIAVHPGDSNIVIAGGGNGYVYLSENGASSWVYSTNMYENSMAGHARSDGVGVAMPYYLTAKTTKQYRVSSSDVQNGDTYSSPWIDWHGPQPTGSDMLAVDGRCCGWGTDNKFGYFVATGKMEVSPSGPEVMQTEDTGNYNIVTNNLQTVLSSASQGQCIGWEGGEWDE